MRRALTVGLPALASAALLIAAATEVAFLLSPAAGYCPEYGGVLEFCLFPPSEIAAFTIGVALVLAGAGVGSLILAWRGHFGAASASALPGVLGVVVVALIAIGHQSAPTGEPLLNPPPPGYGLYGIGGEAGLVGVILLGAACCFQLDVRFRRPR